MTRCNISRRSWWLVAGIWLAASPTNSQGAEGADLLSGPRSVEQDLQPGDGLLNPQFRTEVLVESMASWFDFKGMLKEERHLDLGFDYTVVGQFSDADIGEGKGIGHDLRFFGTWTPVNPDGPGAGSLVMKFESREAYSRLPPQNVGLDAGAVAITAAQFSDAGWVLTNLYWKQRFLDDRFVIGFGQVDTTDYADVFALANPVWGFTNLVFSVSPAIPEPNQGLGAAVGYWFTDTMYVNAGIADANGNPASPDFDVFDTGETFKHIEFGITPSRDLQFLDHLHVTLWQVDEREAAGVADDWGASVSWMKLIGNRWAPFARAGWADGGAALYDRSASVGLGYLTVQQDLLGVGLNWANPYSKEDSLRDQWTLEAFYKFQISRTLAVSADLQVISDPALNPDDDLVTFIALRIRGAF